MIIDGNHYRTVWFEDGKLNLINQPLLPHRFEIVRFGDFREVAEAIETMVVRGAPAIGATGAFAMALAEAEGVALDSAAELLRATRPTAQDLFYGIERVLRGVGEGRKALDVAQEIADDYLAACKAIGEHGAGLIQDGMRLNTHCNAGWLATVDWGTALAPIYRAHDAGIPVHVWVDETRPRNQGAALTAWELAAHGVPHDLIVDNAGGHLMQHGMVDLCITGTDRTARNGDVCNKIGTYLKALAAYDNGVPFYVGLPGPTIDWEMVDGVAGIPIEERDAQEVIRVRGRLATGETGSVQITPDGVSARNYAFDVTPARLVTGLITERGICAASEQGLTSLYPQRGATGDD